MRLAPPPPSEKDFAFNLMGLLGVSALDIQRNRPKTTIFTKSLHSFNPDGSPIR